MKIRYYLRGLGIGILFTAIFFLITDSGLAAMSDEQIKARAKELGMTENTVLAELSTEQTLEEEETETELAKLTKEENTSEEAALEEASEEETKEIPETESEVETQEQTQEQTSEVIPEEEHKAPVQEPAAESEQKEASETVTSQEYVITVNSGEGSDTVSARLKEAGLITDAKEYDRYLVTNGYDKKIRVGEHVIPAGADWEAIAKSLCTR